MENTQPEIYLFRRVKHQSQVVTKCSHIANKFSLAKRSSLIHLRNLTIPEKCRPIVLPHLPLLLGPSHLITDKVAKSGCLYCCFVKVHEIQRLRRPPYLEKFWGKAAENLQAVDLSRKALRSARTVSHPCSDVHLAPRFFWNETWKVPENWETYSEVPYNSFHSRNFS